MRKRGTQRRQVGLHPAIAAGIRRAEKQRKADMIARPMRDLFALLSTGEVFEVEGKAVMRMPEVDASVRTDDAWVEIAPAIFGWIDCWHRIEPAMRQDKLRYLAERLERGQEVTPRLVEQARAEFEAAIARIPDLDPGVITRAISTTQIAWEMEKLMGQAA